MVITDETEEFCFDKFKIKLNFDDDHNLNGVLYVEVNENMELYNFIETNNNGKHPLLTLGSKINRDHN